MTTPKLRRGLWRATEEQELYPNPAAVRRVPHALPIFHFLGRMVGKALYEVCCRQRELHLHTADLLVACPRQHHAISAWAAAAFHAVGMT